MSKRDNGQTEFLFEGVRLFLKTPDISQMTIQNDSGAISVVRATPKRTDIRAIGFTADFNDEDNYEGDC